MQLQVEIQWLDLTVPDQAGVLANPNKLEWLLQNKLLCQFQLTAENLFASYLNVNARSDVLSMIQMISKISLI